MTASGKYNGYHLFSPFYFNILPLTPSSVKKRESYHITFGKGGFLTSTILATKYETKDRRRVLR